MRVDRYAFTAAFVASLLLFASSVYGQAPDPDLNDDGVVNVLDVSLVSSCLGVLPSTASTCAVADVDGDGDVDTEDLDLVSASFDESGFPICGDGVVNRAAEQCDGADFVGCGSATCQSTCICDPLVIQIASPISLVTLGASPIEVIGTVNSPTAVLTLNGVTVPNAAGSFAGLVALQEGHNTIVARAIDGVRQTTDSISVSIDQTPPYVTIESHVDGQTVYSDTVTVTGLINDIVRGTIEEAQAEVTVNGQSASISNRSYAAVNVPLSEGVNVITVVGTDQVGNTASQSITLNYIVPSGRRIEILGGQNQAAPIAAVLPVPLAVRVLDDTLAAVSGASVVFRVSQGSGAVGATGLANERAVVVQTDAAGIASTTFKLGTRSGSANQKVRARVVGYDDEAIFFASATNNIGNKISINSGNNQRGSVGQVLPESFVVSVTDDGANVVQGARVRFEVARGGGTLPGGVTAYETQTDSDGRATATYTLGSLQGIDAQRVTATLLDGPPGQTINAGFTASAFVSGDPGQTSISGVVLDNQDAPIPGVTVRVDGSAREAIADDQGQFVITEAPVGPVHLIADGSTAAVPGEFPSLSYNLVTVPGAANPLPAPIYMVKLDTNSAVYAGPQDVAIELASYPGFRLEIAANSVTFPDGSREGLISVTPVNADKVPMAPPNGMQPQFIVTIQPANTRFDPPARLSLPNVDAHAPGAQTEMYSYDHDLEEFVSIGLGTASEDGSVIQSNAGVGVVKAGWHCGSDPEGQGCAAACQECTTADLACICQFDNSLLPISLTDRENDCRRPACNFGPLEIADTVDLPEDIRGDCRAPSCDGASPSSEPDDNDDPGEACMSCMNGELSPLTSIVIRPAPEAGPLATSNMTPSDGIVDEFGAVDFGEPAYTTLLRCTAVCEQGQERFLILGDIVRTAWSVTYRTMVIGVQRECPATMRTADAISRTRTHEERHRDFFLQVLNDAKMRIFSQRFTDLSECQRRLEIEENGLDLAWNNMVVRQDDHLDFRGDPRYRGVCRGGVTVEEQFGMY